MVNMYNKVSVLACWNSRSLLLSPESAAGLLACQGSNIGFEQPGMRSG